MKKSLTILMGMTALMAMTACGGGNDSGGDSKITIKYVNAYGKNYQPQIEKFIAAFEKENTDIHVENVVISGNYDTIHTQTKSDIQAANGEYGDLVICYPDHVVDYIEFGVAQKLDSLMDDPEIGWTAAEKADVFPGFLTEGQKYPIEGTYSLPYSKSTEALYYNEDVIIGLNLSEQDPTINNGQPLNADYIDNLTWEEFFDKLCPAIMAKNEALPADEKLIIDAGEGGLTGICGYDSTANLFINLCEQYGYPYTSVNTSTGKGSVDFNTPELKALMAKFNDAAQKNYLIPSSRISNNSYCSSYFTAQNLLFNIGSTAGVGHEQSDNFNTGVTYLPGAKNGNKHVISQGPSLCILAHPEDGKEMKNARVQAAWKFYKYLTTSVNSANWALTVGYLPIRTSSLSTERYLEYADATGKAAKSLELLNAKNAQYSTKASTTVFTSPVFKGSSTARTQVGSLMSAVMNEANPNYDSLFSSAVNEILKDMEG